jgi:predicted TIM-barrel fold metal-dependent hydrolase
MSFSGPIGASGAWPEDHPDHHAAIMAIKTTFGGFGGYGDPIAIETMGHVVGGGVLDRFPSLQLLFVECGARWLANAMDTMDEAWYRGPGVRDVNRVYVMPDGRRVRQYQPDELDLEWTLPLMPSEYIRRQIHLTFQDDWVALRNRDITGIEPLVWGNDYSHYEGSWPRSLEAIRNQSKRANLSDEEQRAIFGGTLASLLGLEFDQLVA